MIACKVRVYWLKFDQYLCRIPTNDSLIFCCVVDLHHSGQITCVRVYAVCVAELAREPWRRPAGVKGLLQLCRDICWVSAPSILWSAFPHGLLLRPLPTEVVGAPGDVWRGVEAGPRLLNDCRPPKVSLAASCVVDLLQIDQFGSNLKTYLDEYPLDNGKQEDSQIPNL